MESTNDRAGRRGPLRHNGVYRLDAEDHAPEFFVALENEEAEGDYAYALARAVPIPGAGFTYDDSDFLIFVERPAEEGPRARLYTVFHDAEARYDGRPVSDLADTGLLAASPHDTHGRQNVHPTPTARDDDEAAPARADQRP